MEIAASVLAHLMFIRAIQVPTAGMIARTRTLPSTARKGQRPALRLAEATWTAPEIFRI